MLTGRDVSKLLALQSSLGSQVEVFPVDLIVPQQVIDLKKYAFDTLGTPSRLINCAGNGLFGKLSELNDEDIASTLLINQLPVILPCKAFVEPMKVQGAGTIVNIMSTAAQKGKAGESIYCAAKWGVRGFTEALREELKGSSVKVIAVYPAGMNTGFWDKADVGYPTDSFMSPQEAAELIVSSLNQAERGFISELTLSR